MFGKQSVFSVAVSMNSSFSACVFQAPHELFSRAFSLSDELSSQSKLEYRQMHNSVALSHLQNPVEDQNSP